MVFHLLTTILIIYFFQVASTLRVNGAPLLTLSYDPPSSSEALLSVSGQKLVNVTYDSLGRPVTWVPVAPLVPSNVTYDHWGHITSWHRGYLSENYTYDSHLRLESVMYADGSRVNYDYREDYTKVSSIDVRLLRTKTELISFSLHCKIRIITTLDLFSLRK